MPEYLIDQLKTAGFDFLSLANNHANDFGLEGIENTKLVLDNLEIGFAGLESCPWDTISIGGITYGFCAFAPNTGTIQIDDYEYAKKIVQNLNSISDIVIVSFHGGAEGTEHKHVPKTTEFIYGENRGNVFEFSHLVIDNGADIVFGHGPHVTRAIEIYKGRFIAYSLGNFATYARFNLNGEKGIAPIIQVKTKLDGEFIEGKIIPIRQLGEGGPEIDPHNMVIAEIKELVKADFPESLLKIEDNGSFYLKDSTK
jgi:poly-gamma-glutamate capsule biosynthesis protein CapA/YwtB (metallophosphatase superfamily)